MIIEELIAGNLEAFLAVMATVYESAGYHGHVDIGVALEGLGGAASLVRQGRWFEDFTYGAAKFTRTGRVAAAELHRPDEVAHGLLRHFYEATTGIDGYNPFEPAPKS